MKTTTTFPVRWRDKSQRDFRSRFCKALGKIQDTFGFGASFTIAIDDAIEFTFDYANTAKADEVNEAVVRIQRCINRWRKKGVFD